MALLVFDLDGTLLDEATQKIPEQTLLVLEKLYSLHTIAIITGRWELPPEYIDRIPHHIRATSNGGRILNPKKVFSTHYLSPEEVQTALNTIPPEARTVAFSEDTLYANQPDSTYFVKWLKILPVKPLTEATSDSILKMNFTHPHAPEIRQRLEAALPHITFSGGIEPYLDFLTIVPKEANKGSALKEIAQILNIDLKDTFVFGDSDNDIDMLALAGHAVQVGNQPYLQHLAHSTVRSPLELASWLEEHLLKAENQP